MDKLLLVENFYDHHSKSSRLGVSSEAQTQVY